MPETQVRPRVLSSNSCNGMPVTTTIKVKARWEDWQEPEAQSKEVERPGKTSWAESAVWIVAAIVFCVGMNWWVHQ